MRELKTNPMQIEAIIDDITNGWKLLSCDDNGECMSVYLEKDDGTEEPETRIYDMEVCMNVKDDDSRPDRGLIS